MIRTPEYSPYEQADDTLSGIVSENRNRHKNLTPMLLESKFTYRIWICYKTVKVYKVFK